MLNAFIIVWRESLEALLVISVLLSWIARQEQPAGLRRGLWGGALGGVALAVGLGFATFAVQSEFAGESLEIFQLAMVLGASALILHMVLWMHQHGRDMKRQLEGQAARAASAWGIATIAALAVAREGAETVVFLYGLGLEGSGTALLATLGAATAGLGAAAATAWLAARGARLLNYRTLFRISEIFLLLIANALLISGVDRMISLDWLPALIDPVWDLSALLADGQGVGRLLADFTGYRARPAATVLLASAAFWAFAFWRMKQPSTPKPALAVKA
ncbi:MAG: FTR1 family protein [Comamonadaceae bacterium]|jgi:high-affinity iron transporter|nr:FTR1 family protein [Comamonadaceae bacterium]